MPKTIFITISRGSIAKNFLHNDFYRILQEADSKIVLLSPAYGSEEFKKLFGGQNIFFEPLFEHKWSALDYFFTGVHKGLVYNETTELRDRFGILNKAETNAARRIFKNIFFKPLSCFGFFKEAARFFDYIFCPGKKYYGLFEKYRPDIVFSTNPMDDADSYVLKAAKHFKVKIIAMSKSWDNLSKMNYRVKPDKLLEWGKWLVGLAVKFQNMKKENVITVGAPQFDIYARPGKLLSREDFFERIGIDPGKKLLVFGSDAKYSPNDPEIIEMILEWIKNRELAEDCALYIRPYFSNKNDEKKFEKFIGRENVVVDHWFVRNNIFRDSWDYSYENLVHFSSLIKYLSIMMNYSSTLTLDAAVCDHPVIGIAFDGSAPKPFGESVARWYDSAHFKDIVDSGGLLVARSAEELKSAINLYLKNPNIRGEGRKKLRDEFCCGADGGAGERIARLLLI